MGVRRDANGVRKRLRQEPSVAARHSPAPIGFSNMDRVAGRERGAGHAAKVARDERRLAACACRVRHSRHGPGRVRPAGRRLLQCSHAIRRSRPVCRALRARPALPRLGFLLSRNRKHQCRLLAEVQGHAAGRVDLLRVRRAWHRRHRAAERTNRVRDRPLRRRLPPVRRARRRGGQELPACLRGRGRLSRLDLCAAWLCRVIGSLLFEEPHHPSGAQAMLYLRRGTVAGGGELPTHSRRALLRSRENAPEALLDEA